jgi:lantibiotic modifying enzyme
MISAAGERLGGLAARHLTAADAIGRALADDAVWHEHRCTWIGAEYEPGPGGWETVHRSCAHDLYGGTSGIGLFLGHLSAATGDERQRRTAIAAARQALWGSRRAGPGASAGLYDGASGPALVAVVLAEPLACEELRDAGDAAAGELAAAVERDPLARGCDVISGAAGAVLALVALAGALGRPALLHAARHAGDALLRAAQPTPLGLCWPPPVGSDPTEPALCGLAHGASGVAWALLELHEATGETAYARAAADAVRWERGSFDRRHGTWPDRRAAAAGADAPGAASWCHGAVGIGLARLREHELTGSDAAVAEVGAAIQAARGEALRGAPALGTGALQGNFSLCHGLGGIVELLVVAAQTLEHEEHLAAARRLGEHGLLAAQATGAWRCGLPEGGEAPGLMLGLAGIGACQLRLAQPELMPQLGLLGGCARPGAA